MSTTILSMKDTPNLYSEDSNMTLVIWLSC